MQTADSALVKKMNKAIVLNVIRQSSPISRAAVSRITGLNKATVSALTAELIDEGHIIEVGTGHSTGGRRPQLLSFNAGAGLVLGVELGVTFMRALICNLSGELIESRELDLPVKPTPEEGVRLLVELCHTLMAVAPPTQLGVIGAGIGVPGSVDLQLGTVLVAPNLSWRGVRLEQALERALGLPVIIDNEANASALGEKMFGIGTRADNLIYISLGVGLGAGVINDGRLLRGSHGIAGEVGHMTIESGGPLCSCGNRGCWELYCSEKALRKRLPAYKEMKLNDIIAAAEKGAPEVIAALHEIGIYLGIGLTNLVHAFDPELVVVGGPLAQAGKWLLNPAQRTLQSRLMPGPARQVPLLISNLGLNACALGAAAHLLEERYKTPGVSTYKPSPSIPRA
ncbi:MAG TPA: ROK family protein [Firmicutes bacterium]|nr:ROK family protein [Bacillota bacterium]